MNAGLVRNLVEKFRGQILPALALHFGAQQINDGVFVISQLTIVTLHPKGSPKQLQDIL